jgi:hypothetical protein
MASSSDGNVTTINATYLTGLRTSLEDLLTGVEQQIRGEGSVDAMGSSGTVQVPPVTGNPNFSVSAGGVMSNDGTSTFDITNDLNSALQQMGGTVEQELDWLRRVLTDMISEIGTTITSMKNADSLNSDSVNTLEQDFQTTINDINTPPVSGSGGGGSGSGSSGSGSSS